MGEILPPDEMAFIHNELQTFNINEVNATDFQKLAVYDETIKKLTALNDR